MNTRLAGLLAIITIIVLFGFPKAGFYVSGVPITFGYFLLALMSLGEMFYLATHHQRRLQPRYLWLIVLLFALAVLELFAFRIYGSQGLGAMVSILVSTIAMPVLTLLATGWMIRVLGISRVLRTLRWALVPVFIFGILSFAIYNATGKVVGIPYITTTGSDLSLVAARHNLRGPIIKMFSTYNNGNILGINLLLWGPIAAFSVVPVAAAYRTLCILTLSRSVWAGLIALEVLGAVLERSIGRVVRAIAGAVLLIVAVILASTLIGKDPVQFLLDKDLGGRVTSLQNDLEVISTQRIGWDSESLYAASYLAFGPLGLVLITAVWSIPIFSGGTSELQKTARMVMVVYLAIAAVEGAFTLVPTQAVYWFVAAIAMRRDPMAIESSLNPSTDESAHLDVASEPVGGGQRRRQMAMSVDANPKSWEKSR